MSPKVVLWWEFVCSTLVSCNAAYTQVWFNESQCFVCETEQTGYVVCGTWCVYKLIQLHIILYGKNNIGYTPIIDKFT